MFLFLALLLVCFWLLVFLFFGLFYAPLSSFTFWYVFCVCSHCPRLCIRELSCVFDARCIFLSLLSTTPPSSGEVELTQVDTNILFFCLNNNENPSMYVYHNTIAELAL
jgi:hypothetical protein